jgi:hypothetical protein
MATADGPKPMRHSAGDCWPWVVGKAIDTAAKSWGQALRLCLVVVVSGFLLMGVGVAFTSWWWLSHAR